LFKPSIAVAERSALERPGFLLFVVVPEQIPGLGIVDEFDEVALDGRKLSGGERCSDASDPRLAFDFRIAATSSPGQTNEPFLSHTIPKFGKNAVCPKQ
jgi:hypothetical protein